MRDLFEDIFAGNPIDPMESARGSLRARSRKKFYQHAEVAPSDGQFAILLDGRPVRTPARKLLAAPNETIGQTIATEWEAQREVIEPARMPLTRLANSIIDGVAEAPGAVAGEIAEYLGSDLLFYRAETPKELVKDQAALWDPIIAWARDVLGAHFMLTQGIVFVAQPGTALAAARAAIPEHPWILGALHTVTTLTGSALLALALGRGKLSTEEVWRAAHVDEDWNMQQWGRDDIAMARRDVRFTEMQAAAQVLNALMPR